MRFLGVLWAATLVGAWVMQGAVKADAASCAQTFT